MKTIGPMKTIGMIGGLSWESSLIYYRLLNQAVRERLGGLHSARILMHSVDFAEFEAIQREGRWADGAQILVDAARGLERAGASFVVLATNTMHRVAGEIENNLNVPFLHIADAAGRAVKAHGLSTVGLLGTRFTMEQDFYRLRLAARYDLNVLIPEEEDRALIHDVIYNELCLGQTREESKANFIAIIRRLIDSGAEGVILGCTEIGMLIGPQDISVPSFDTTRTHVDAAVDLALA